MSEVINFPRETTIQHISGLLEHQSTLLEVIAMGSAASNITSLSSIRRIVQNGMAEKFFCIGDRINVNWTDIAAQKTYEVPLDVVHFGEVELKNGEIVPGMFLQWHYAIPFAVQFDNYEAFYYAEEELPAGTYNITMGNNWGNNVVSGKTYQFTLTQAVPAGGQLAGFRAMSEKAPAEWKVYSYASKTSETPIETLDVAEGNEGTSLGIMSSITKYANSGINNMQRVGYGYNRWSQSGYRQFLNSKAGVGAWWTPQHNFDRAPDQLATKAGFLSGFDDDFLNCIGEIKVVTNLNTVSDSEIGAQEITYDKFFLPSLEQLYVNPQLAGEGDYWEYWKKATGATAPQAQYGTYPERITYGIDNKAAAQSTRLRSAFRGSTGSTWSVYASGFVHSPNASSAYRCTPDCVIC